MGGVESWVPWALALCAIGFVGGLAVLVYLGGRGVWRLVTWDRGEHVARPVRPVREAWVPWDTDPRFGSMQLVDDRGWAGVGSHVRATEAEQGWQGSPRSLLPLPPAPEVAHEEDWRDQTAAALAPAVLDSGPGCTSLAPGPDLAGVDSHVRATEAEQGWQGSPRSLPPLPPADPDPEPEPERTVAGRLVETSDEWLRRLVANAAPGWTYAGTVAA